MGTTSVKVKSKPDALNGHPAETNLGLVSETKNPYRYLPLKT